MLEMTEKCPFSQLSKYGKIRLQFKIKTRSEASLLCYIHNKGNLNSPLLFKEKVEYEWEINKKQGTRPKTWRGFYP